MNSPLDKKDEPVKEPERQEKLDASKEAQESSKLSIDDLIKHSQDSIPGSTSAPRHTEQSTIDFSTADPNRDLARYSNDLKRELSQSSMAEGSANREFRWAPKNFESTGSGLTSPVGNRQFFRPVKSEFKSSTDEASSTFKAQIDKFLTETTPPEDSHLTAAEKLDLSNTRRNLVESSNSTDALSNALHLARVYQHLRYIEEAKKAVQLSLGIDPDNMQGRQMFKELERMHPVDISVATRAINSVRLSKSALRERIYKLAGGKIIVLGDLLIDELLEGKPERISREAPVLILEHVDTVLIPGGAANTAHNIAALGGTCHAIGVCGHDDYAAKLEKLLETHGISHGLVQDESRPTTVKTRILSKSHSLMQQLLRLDRIAHEPISAAIEEALVAKVNQTAPYYKAIVLSDYKAGVISDRLISACREVSSKHNLLVIVDAQQSFERFQGATLMTPNQPDTEKFVGYSLNTSEDLQRAGKEILEKTKAKSLLVTRGADGMVLFQQGSEMVELPAFNRSDVFDVTGAGDTVVGTMALALVTGATFIEAMALGNLAAGIVVRKSGTAVTTQKEMLENLELLDLDD